MFQGTCSPTSGSLYPKLEIPITLTPVQGPWLCGLGKRPNIFCHHHPVDRQGNKHLRDLSKGTKILNTTAQTINTSKLSNSDFIVPSTLSFVTKELVQALSSIISVLSSLPFSIIISYSGHRVLLTTVQRQNFSDVKF